LGLYQEFNKNIEFLVFCDKVMSHIFKGK